MGSSGYAQKVCWRVLGVLKLHFVVVSGPISATFKWDPPQQTSSRTMKVPARWGDSFFVVCFF